MPLDLERMRLAGRRAALVGGRTIRTGIRPAHGDAKGLPGDWVTEVDLASEGAIRSFLEEETPTIPMHGEETGGAPGGRRWVVDPLDGTTNYVHDFWAVGVSVALVADDRVVSGAVFAPFLGDLWHCSRGGGAIWERAGVEPASCRVAERVSGHAVVATGFPFRHKERIARHLKVVEGALRAFEDLRRPGAASLDLAWTACGVFDGFFELGLAPWDVAAGGLLVEEAGGIVTDWEGGPNYLSGDILAGSLAVHEELQRIVRSDGPA